MLCFNSMARPLFSDDDDTDDQTLSNSDGEDIGNIDEDVSSLQVVPYFGMPFDNIDEAKKLYNDYTYKM